MRVPLWTSIKSFGFIIIFSGNAHASPGRMRINEVIWLTISEFVVESMSGLEMIR